jgi:catechol 2,3-dioxygenase
MIDTYTSINKSTPTGEISATQLLPASTRLGAVHIAVTDGERAKAFWTGYVGLTVLAEDATSISLGAGDQELVVLHPGATSPVVPRRTGLYHLALHVPTRKELARVIARLFALRYPNSPTDHTVSETTYLSDPDGNGIELTFETPERGEFVIVNGQYMARMADGTVREGNAAVDLDSLFGELTDADDLAAPMPAGTRIGHVHLHVADLIAADTFYRNLIGFAPFMSMPAIQMADYSLATSTTPHALALNTWQGAGAPPAPEGTSGLRHFTITVPASADVEVIAARLHRADWHVEAIPGGISLLDPARNLLHIVATSAS